jgi:hypothetical protein
MKRFFALGGLAMLAGCAAVPPPAAPPLVVTKTIYVPWAWPAYLKTCAADLPAFPVPHVAATDPAGGSKVARYVVGLRNHDQAEQAVADDCRSTLAAALQANQVTGDAQ